MFEESLEQLIMHIPFYGAKITCDGEERDPRLKPQLCVKLLLLQLSADFLFFMF